MNLAMAIFPFLAALCARWRATPGPHSPLRSISKRNGPAVIVSVGGEIDASNEHLFEHLVSKMATTAVAPGPFVIDLRNLNFIGCGAFNILARQARRCRRSGIKLRVISRDSIVAQIVATRGLRPLLSIHPTVETALSAAAAGRPDQ